MNHFLVLEQTNLNEPNYRIFAGCTYPEEKLRAWAHKSFNVAQDAPLEKISAALRAGGWLVFQYISPQE